MSLDLTHGFLAEAQITQSVMARIFASSFKRRVDVLRTTVTPGRDLEIWFESPRLTLVENPDPAANVVEIELRMIARLSDRFDEARATVTARARLTDRKVPVGSATRACPSLDFNASAAPDFKVSSNNPAYDAAVLSAVTNLLRRNSPFSVGPLALGGGRRTIRTYFGVPVANDNVMALFMDLGGDPRPTPATITGRTGGVVLLVPDDFVNQGIQKGLNDAGLGSLPAQLNPDVRVHSFSVQLQNGHVLISGSATNTTEVLSIPIDTDFSFKAFVQLLVEDGRIVIHVISTQQDLDGGIVDFADFISAGAITRLMERLVPRAVESLALGNFQGLTFFSDTVPAGSDFVPASVGSLLSIFPNGIGIPYGVTAPIPPDSKPPYIRGHRESREFHVQGCQFGDQIGQNLRRFPRREAAIQAGYDGCATCQPAFSVASFGDLMVTVTQPAGTPAQQVTMTASYEGNVVRFGIPLAPPQEKRVSKTPFDDNGVLTHLGMFNHIVPAKWMLTLETTDWEVTAPVGVAKRFVAADGQLQGPRTEVRAVVGVQGLELLT